MGYFDMDGNTATYSGKRDLAWRREWRCICWNKGKNQYCLPYEIRKFTRPFFSFLPLPACGVANTLRQQRNPLKIRPRLCFLPKKKPTQSAPIGRHFATSATPFVLPKTLIPASFEANWSFFRWVKFPLLWNFANQGRGDFNILEGSILPNFGH